MCTLLINLQCLASRAAGNLDSAGTVLSGEILLYGHHSSVWIFIRNNDCNPGSIARGDCIFCCRIYIERETASIRTEHLEREGFIQDIQPFLHQMQIGNYVIIGIREGDNTFPQEELHILLQFKLLRSGSHFPIAPSGRLPLMGEPVCLRHRKPITDVALHHHRKICVGIAQIEFIHRQVDISLVLKDGDSICDAAPLESQLTGPLCP